MIFRGISRKFSLRGDGQYDTIGRFWDEMEKLYALERLVGLGYKWEDGFIYYAIGLKDGDIDDADFELELPDGGWTSVHGLTDDLPAMYTEIYKSGRLSLELETFTKDGRCEIKYRR